MLISKIDREIKKICNLCKEPKDDSELVKYKERIVKTCKVCYNERNKRNRALKPGASLLARKIYRQQNKEKDKAYYSEYYKKNKERISEVQRAWYQKNKESIKLKNCLK